MSSRSAGRQRRRPSRDARAVPRAGARLAVAALCAAAAAVVLVATGVRTTTATPQTATRGISLTGTVHAAPEGSPLAGTTITLRHVDAGTSTQTVTGPDGTFAFADLAAGHYALHAAKPGYVATNYGADPRGLAPGLVLALDAGQTLSRLDMTLARGGAVAGRLSDETGAPVAAAEVSALVRHSSDLGTRWTRAAVAVSDDRGTYRLFGLADAEYAIVVVRRDLGASPGPPRPPTLSGRPAAAPAAAGATARNLPPFAPVFYPGTTDPDAAVFVRVQPASDQSGVDIRVVAEPAAEIEGVLTAASRVTLRQVRVTLTATPDSPFAALGYPRARPAVVTPTGHFTFERVPRGTYGVLATTAAQVRPGDEPPATNTAERPWYAAATAIVGEVGFVGLDPMTLLTGLRVAGTVTMAGGPSAPGPERVVVRLARVPDGQPIFDVPPARVQADGSFNVTGVPPGRYLLSAGLSGRPPGDAPWHMDRATAAGQDVLDAPLDVRVGEDVTDLAIHFTNRVTELTGTMFDPAGQPSYAYYLLVFPVQSSRWTRGSRWLRGPTRPTSDGTFRIVGLPAGDYHLAAVAEYDPDGWWTPSFLQQAAAASLRVSLVEGQPLTQNIRVGAGGRR